MSPLGIVHTTVSVLPIGFGLAGFLRHGRIDPKTRMGKLYIGTMLAGSLTALGFIASKGFTPAQVLTFATLGLLLAGLFTFRGQRRAHGIVQTISLSASYLLLWVFTTTEALTRVPVGTPFAAGPDDPALVPVRLALLAAFLVGLVYQLRALRRVTSPSPVAAAVRV
jgi:hypothetical protein